MINPLVKQFGKDSRWVNWKLLKMKGKLTKIPYATTGRKASSVDPKTWSTFAEAQKASPNIGIVFKDDKTLLGIDIDHCIEGNEIVHPQSEIITDFLIAADTYTEISPSKTGLHIFLNLTAPLDLTAHKKAPFELYNVGRYFTFTGESFGSKIRPVRTVSTDEALAILKVAGYPWEKETAGENGGSPLSTASTSPAVSLSDQSILDKMMSSKHGKDIQALYDGDLSAHNDDASAADMALCSHLAFWSGKNSIQMDRIWLASPLGSRKKTKERADYRARTIANAIAGCKETYSGNPEAEKVKAIDKLLDLDLLFTLNSRKDKVYTQNTENMCRILRKHPDFAGRLRYDEFKGIFEIQSIPSKVWRGFEDNDAVNIQTYISILFPYFGKVGKEMIYDAMIKVAKENMIDSAADYLRAIKWDKKPRLDDWLSSAFGVEKNVYHGAVASNWLKGVVKRIIEPGCKFDYVLVLEGPQGSKKSTSLAVLGGSWHVETTMSTDSKDFFMQFQGKAIIEFSEGETLSRTEVKRMKAIITMQTDKYRPPYERSSQEFPRRCVFAMTTNQTEYLKDETGNRRWLPVAVVLPEADVEWIRANKDQLYAEAYYRVVIDKEKIYEFPKEETRLAQEERRIRDSNADQISDWYYNKLSDKQRDEGITLFQVYRDAIHNGYVTKPLDKYNEMSISDVLKSVVKLTKERRMAGGARLYKWFLTATPVADEESIVAAAKTSAVPVKAKHADADVEEILGGIGW